MRLTDEDADEDAVASSSYHYYVSRDETGTTVSTVYVESISKGRPLFRNKL